MKSLICIVLLILICSCSGNPDPLKAPDILPEKHSRYTTLLNKFEEVSIDTLFIYNEKEFDKFKGVQVDSSETSLFPKKFFYEHYPVDQGIFACLKFQIDADKTGLIARTPAFYRSSSLKLFVYNKTLDSITDAIEVAELWGDAGSRSDKVSWIFKDGSGKLQVLISRIESQDLSVMVNEDHEVHHMSRDGIAFQNFLYRIGLSENSFDTISKDTGSLKKQFASPLKKSGRFEVLPIQKK